MKVRECSRESFLAFVEYMYVGLGGKLMEGADEREPYTLAEVYGVSELKEYLLDVIDEGCIAAAAVYGRVSGCGDEVVEGCVKAAWDCLGKVSEESLKGVPVDLACDLLRGHEGKDAVEGFEFASRWWRSHGEGCRGGCWDAEGLVDGVDFRRMPVQFLTDVVKPSGVMKGCATKMSEIVAQQLKSEAWGRSRFSTETRQYGSYGTGPGQCQDVTGIALLPDSEGIAVVDSI